MAKKSKPKKKRRPKVLVGSKKEPAAKRGTLAPVTEERNLPVTDWAPSLKQQKFLEVASQSGLTRNISKLCREAGVTRISFYRWYEEQPGFRQALNELPRLMLAKHLPGVYAALLRRAESGDLEAIRMTFEVVGDLQKPVAGNGGPTLVQIVLGNPDAQKKILDAQMVTPEGKTLPQDGNGANG